MASRARTTAVLLSTAIVVGAAGLAPTASAGPQDTGGLTLPNRAEAVQIRERAERLEVDGPALRSEAVGSSGVTEVVPDTVANPMVWRVDGLNRYEVGANLSWFWEVYFWDETVEPYPWEKTVFLASGEVFSDALAGGALAGNAGGPVLLTYKDRLPQVTKDALTALQPDSVVVLGGTNTITASVETDLAPYAPPGEIYRIEGADRYQVSANIADVIGPSPRAYVATGLNWPDGLAGGAAAGYEYAPLLLTKTADVPDAVMDVLATVTQPEEIIVLGGPNTIDDAVLRELETIAPVVTRVGGRDRYEVAANVADLLPTTREATMATGLNWPDALAGSAYAGLTGDKVLLLRPTGVPADTRQAVLDHILVHISMLGGLTSLPESVAVELEAMEVPLP